MTQQRAQRSFNRFAEQSVYRKAADRRELLNNVRSADVGLPSRPCFRSAALLRAVCSFGPLMWSSNGNGRAWVDCGKGFVRIGDYGLERLRREQS